MHKSIQKLYILVLSTRVPLNPTFYFGFLLGLLAFPSWMWVSWWGDT